MVTKEGVRADPEKVQIIIQSLTPKSPSQIRSLFLQLITIGKFIPNLAKLKYPINKVRMRMDAKAGSGWMNEAEEALQRIKIKLNKLSIPKEGEKLMLCMRQRNRMISSVLMGASFNSHSKIPKDNLQETQGDSDNRWTSGGNTKAFQKRRMISKMGKETIKEGLGVGIIIVSPDEKMHSYAIRLKFNTFDHAMDCEALLVGLVASVNKGMKDLHVFIDSLTLVAQIKGNHMPAIEQERKYKEEIMDATAPFH
ncbi:reverse transcriptase domain-containing protein, partial [Tanacetum coccineum]